MCGGRSQGGVAALQGERAQRDSQGSLRGLGIMDEPKPECFSTGAGALTVLGGGNDSVTRIVNKRFMRQTVGEEMVTLKGGGKETMSNGAAAVTEVRCLGIQFHF